MIKKPIPVGKQTGSGKTLPRVSICCMTHDHENFIREALAGFLMQETDFPVEILIHDDASTDHTSAILREYRARHPDLIRLILQTENQTARGQKVHLLLYAQARGQYLALCEGDDYWTDPRKLQKQVDALEADPNAAIAAHQVKYLYDAPQGSKHRLSPREKEAGALPDIVKRNYLPTVSVMLRRSAMPDLKWLEEITRKLTPPLHSDWPLFVFTALSGGIIFLNEPLGVYRIHPGSTWSSLPLEKQASLALQARRVIMSNLRGMPSGESAQIWSASYLEWAKKLKAHNKNWHALYFLFRAFVAAPWKQRKDLE